MSVIRFILYIYSYSIQCIEIYFIYLQLQRLMSCCCRRKRFLQGMTKMISPCMLLALRENEAAMDVSAQDVPWLYLLIPVSLLYVYLCLCIYISSHMYAHTHTHTHTEILTYSVTWLREPLFLEDQVMFAAGGIHWGLGASLRTVQ